MSAAAPAPADSKPTLIDKLGTVLPIALTAIATAFAGMSTAQLQQALFWRTAAGQDQARATNQWTHAGLKRNRSLLTETTAVQLGVQAGATPAEWPAPSASMSAVEKTARDWLDGKGPPRVGLPAVDDDAIRALLDAIRTREPEDAVMSLAARVKPEAINRALGDAEKAVERIDADWDGVVKAAAELVAKAKPGQAAVQAARFALEQRRYRAESSLSMGVGYLYDARVRVVTAVSERHRHKSERFFYAMLAAQAGAVVASLAMARKERNVLWLVAGVTGLVALGYGAVVWLG